MCQVFSCIVIRTGKVYPQKEDPSHTAIAKEYGLPEDGKSELLRAKVEVTPRSGFTYADEPSPKAWKIRVDEPSRPDWYNDRHDRAAMVAAKKWWRAHVIAPSAEVTVADGLWIVREGSPQITQSGGEVRTYDSSAPQITQSGGEVRTYDSSAPQITQSGGEVWTYDSSAPQITQSGGVVRAYDSSAPQITQVMK